jgi:quercetin dioxygenase-like cupin family protein
MRLFAAAVATALVVPGLALADQQASALTGAPAAPAEAPAGGVRIAMRQETLPPGGKLSRPAPTAERYLFVVSGRLKVSDLVTGDEQVVEAGKMAAEPAGDWHEAQALGAEPAVVYVIDRTPRAGDP